MTEVSSSYVSEMASHLVETVMINVDDFADSFLTCGTCFSGYGTDERAAKLLPCSHTICRSCLDRILETQAQTETFRCPICRETISIPTGGGGAAAFPPAFIVNQLLDLIATQRRDVVPKCRLHPSQELLFCETCDVVFCTDCRGGSHTVGGNISTYDHQQQQSTDCVVDSDGMISSAAADDSLSNNTLNHNVISFNVAIKRCTEIMLYKMRLCIQELNSAQKAVTAELGRLSANKNACVQSISTKFAEINALVERRQTELLDSVKRIADEKQRALTDQLALIDYERDAVRRECNNLKGILDVRSISKAISYLNEKLDTVSSLTEPRENAFLRYEDCVTIDRSSSSSIRGAVGGGRRTGAATPVANHSIELTTISSQTTPMPTEPVVHCKSDSTDLLDVAHCLAKLGRILVSTTYPPLCTMRLPSQLVVHLVAKAVLQSVNYHGRPQSSGGTDPVEVSFTDPEGRSVPIQPVDMGDGTYELLLRPVTNGRHQLSVQILNRPVRGSPFHLNIRRAQHRIWSVNQGADNHGLIQPFAVAYGPMPEYESEPASGSSVDYIYLLDTGNSRLLVIHPETGVLHTTLFGSALACQAATGITWSPDGLWVVNWRSKSVYLLDPRTDQVIRTIHSSQFVEPTSVCRCSLTGRLFVADNGAGCVFSYNPITGHLDPFLGAGVHGAITKPRDLSPSSTSAAAATASDSSEHTHSPCPEPQSFRRITGLCATDSGLLVVAMGSTIRVFSANGSLLNCLLPPLLQSEFSGHAGNKLISRSSLASSFLEDTISGGGPGMSISRLSRISLGAVPMNSDHCSLSSMRPLQSANSVSPRGQFGGVCVACLDDDGLSDNSNICLLATYSDRRRSGVFVWPQSSWYPQSQTTLSLHCTESPNPTSMPPPYLVEADPGLRRLAGLVTIPKTRHMVVVDQGAQSLCRLLYI